MVFAGLMKKVVDFTRATSLPVVTVSTRSQYCLDRCFEFWFGTTCEAKVIDSAACQMHRL